VGVGVRGEGAAIIDVELLGRRHTMNGRCTMHMGHHQLRCCTCLMCAAFRAGWRFALGPRARPPACTACTAAAKPPAPPPPEPEEPAPGAGQEA
jgi:hypothetical protein